MLELAFNGYGGRRACVLVYGRRRVPGRCRRFAGQVIFGAVEFIENAFLVGLADTDTGISDAEVDTIAEVYRGNRNCASIGVLDRIGDKVLQYFLEVKSAT